MKEYEGKTVLVTGACGTVGSELVRLLAQMDVKKIVCLDNNESEIFFLLERYKSTGIVTGHLTDIRDRDALSSRMRGVDIVLHAAALKHVVLCEDSPEQAIQTNIVGTQNIIDAATKNNVDRVIFTSSDKAVNPTNTMGASKLMGERLMTAAADGQSKGGPIFASTRFGNVLGSRGSVVPLFKSQIEAGGPITLTDKRMTRFIMTLEEAAKLVLESVWIATGGEVMVTKMPVARIEDLAEIMRETLGGGKDIRIVEIGSKPGEKMFEELMNEEEVRRTWDYGNFFVILSAFADADSNDYAHLRDKDRPDRPYISTAEEMLDQTSLKSYLIEHSIL